MREYNRSPAGLAAAERYRKTDKWKAKVRRSNTGPVRDVIAKRYRDSVGGKIMKKLINSSPHAKLSRKLHEQTRVKRER